MLNVPLNGLLGALGSSDHALRDLEIWWGIELGHRCLTGPIKRAVSHFDLNKQNKYAGSSSVPVSTYPASASGGGLSEGSLHGGLGESHCGQDDQR